MNAKPTLMKRLAGAVRSPPRKLLWMRRRRPTLHPWLRGRIRPSNCHDLKEEA